jgi:hypothetical protein
MKKDYLLSEFLGHKMMQVDVNSECEFVNEFFNELDYF